MTKKKPIFPDEEATILHTDMENNPDTGVGSEDGAKEVKNAPMPQTDSKKEVSDEAATIEPESAPVKKPGRKRKKTTDESESDDTPVSTPEAAVPAASKPKKRRSVKLVQEVISIDDERTVETDEDKERLCHNPLQ